MRLLQIFLSSAAMHKTDHDHNVLGLTFVSLRVQNSEEIRQH